MNRNYNPHAPAAVITNQNVHLPHAFHELSPRIVPWMTRERLILHALGVISPSGESLMTNAIFILHSESNDPRPPSDCGGNYRFILAEDEAGRRNQRGEFRQVIERFKHDIHSAVAPAMAKLIHESAIRQNPQAFGATAGRG
jgi:hypothetical protein